MGILSYDTTELRLRMDMVFDGEDYISITTKDSLQIGDSIAVNFKATESEMVLMIVGQSNVSARSYEIDYFSLRKGWITTINCDKSNLQYADRDERYRFGFNGYEKDDEIKGRGNHISFGDYGYDPRIGRRWRGDPLAREFPSIGQYTAFANSPIYLKDLEGKRIVIHYVDADGANQSFVYKLGIKPVDNQFVQQTVAALDGIYAVDKTAKGDVINSPRSHIVQLSQSKNLDVNIYGTAETISDIEATGTNKSVDVIWNANIGGIVVNNSGVETGKKISPMTILGHELGHAMNIFTNTSEYENRKKKLLYAFTNAEEKKVITGIEFDIATYYNEGIRKNHQVNQYSTRTSTSTEEAIPIDDTFTRGKTELEL